MKKVSLIFAVAIIMAVTFVSCNKKEDATAPQKQYVNAIAGSFIAQEGDITLKSADLNKVERTWTWYARSSSFYGNATLALVKGNEFITNSAAYNFWSVAGNNPTTIPVSLDAVTYANLTPDEDLRCVLETKNSNHQVVFLGIVDFNPTTANFPMTVPGFRLGDKLTINADQLFNLPGGDRISITATFNLSPIDLSLTELGTISGVNNQLPAGTQFQWSDIHYGTAASQSVAVTHTPTGGAPIELYDGLDKKVTGTITITVTDNGSPVAPPTGSYSVTVDASAPGFGQALTLTTTKVGWYDSQFNGFNDTDISVTGVSVPVN